MAVKKTSKAGGAAASAPAASKAKAATKKSGKAAPAVASGTTPKAGTPKAAPKAAPKKAAAAPVKLTDRQHDLLKTIHGAKESGYLAEKKAEAKTLEALANKKLIKKGAKDKTSGHTRYHVSKAGEKHIGSSTPPA